MTGKLSRRKGGNGERRVVNLLRQFGLRAKRMLQFQVGHGVCDVLLELRNADFGVEVKTGKSPPSVWKAMEQAVRDCNGRMVPVVVLKRDREEAVWAMRESDMVRFLVELERSNQNAG